MALADPSPDVLKFLAHAARIYAELTARCGADSPSGLGGNLFFAGELDGPGRALVVAANIAGAATLVASADRNAQKQAVRDGIVDFLVTSLDEALRILKNQLRKRETVAVCVVMDPAAVEREMNERGVLPNLLRRDVSFAPDLESLHASEVACSDPHAAATSALIVWRAESSSHRDLALLDKVALDCLGAGQWAARRWLRLAPRYLGRLANGMHLLSAHREFAARFAETIRARVDQGEIASSYAVRVYTGNAEEMPGLGPDKLIHGRNSSPGS